MQGLVSGSYHHCYGRLKWSTDSAGNTPLHIAATKGHLESVGVREYDDGLVMWRFVNTLLDSPES